MQFRNDINGLRAIAVIAVVLFHFNQNWMPGGFAGVDVFFVISGFLMTGIIFRGIEKNNFSIIKFYMARANRIVPALAVLCIALIIFGWFFTLDVVYEKIANHATASLSFISNITYWKESGYFDAGSHEKWLLHSWSLSAEWQFYIAYPLVLVALKKLIPLKAVKFTILLGTLLGFIFCVYITYKWPNAAYYLLPTRAWEMMMGGVAYLYPLSLKEKTKRPLEWLGIFLIISSYILISKETPWPGYMAIFPVLGSFLVIQAQNNASLLTNNIVFQQLGRWSYSIYLWHWPLVVYMYLYLETNTLNIVLLSGLSVFLGMLSYTLVERKVSGKMTFVLWGLALALSVLVYQNNGQFEIREKSQDSGNQILSDYQSYDMDPTGLFTQCNAQIQAAITGSPRTDEICVSTEPEGIFLWGDSHMGALSTGIRAEMEEGTPFSQLTSSGCAPTFNGTLNELSDYGRACNYSNGLAHDAILKSKPSVVILGTFASHEEYDWADTISKLYEMGVPKVIVMGPYPQWRPSLPLVYTRSHMGEEFITDKSFDYALLKSNQFLIDLQAENDNFTFIDVLGSLCFESENNDFYCRAKVGESLTAFDYGHLTVEASRFVTRELLLQHF